jgi:glutathione S-transferase
MALAYSGIRCEIREVDLNNPPEEMTVISPNARVPLLILPDGSVIGESMKIMRWALAQHDPDHWWPDNIIRRQSIRNLLETSNGAFSTALFYYAFHKNYPRRSKEDYRLEGEVFMAELEARLSVSAHLVGEHITLADVAIFPFIYNFARVDQYWFNSCPYPNLRAWMNSFMESALFRQAMEKYPVWRPRNQPVYLQATA